MSDPRAYSEPTLNRDPDEWADVAHKAAWSSPREESRMGKSGYAPRKGQLAEWVLEANEDIAELWRVYSSLFEQLQAAQQEASDMRKAAAGMSADVTQLGEQLGAAERERDSLAARLRAQGYNVTEILAFDAVSTTPSVLSMGERERMLVRVSRDLLRAADEAGGSEHSTKVALGRVDQAQRDLAMVRTALYVRLAQIQGAA